MKDRCSEYEMDVITRPNVLSIAMNISKLKLLWGFKMGPTGIGLIYVKI